jgi:hypothetical protein
MRLAWAQAMVAGWMCSQRRPHCDHLPHQLRVTLRYPEGQGPAAALADQVNLVDTLVGLIAEPRHDAVGQDTGGANVEVDPGRQRAEPRSTQPGTHHVE